KRLVAAMLKTQQIAERYLQGLQLERFRRLACFLDRDRIAQYAFGVVVAAERRQQVAKFAARGLIGGMARTLCLFSECERAAQRRFGVGAAVALRIVVGERLILRGKFARRRDSGAFGACDEL